MSKRTTINIPVDLLKVINRMKKNRPKSSTNELLVELARMGAEKDLMVSLLSAVDHISELINGLDMTEKEGVNPLCRASDSKEMEYLIRVLCIANRFAHGANQELFDRANRDAEVMISKGKKDGF